MTASLSKNKAFFFSLKIQMSLSCPRNRRKYPLLASFIPQKKEAQIRLPQQKKKYLSSCRFSLSFLVLFNFTFPLIKVRLLNVGLLKIMIWHLDETHPKNSNLNQWLQQNG